MLVILGLLLVALLVVVQEGTVDGKRVRKTANSKSIGVGNSVSGREGQCEFLKRAEEIRVARITSGEHLIGQKGDNGILVYLPFWEREDTVRDARARLTPVTDVLSAIDFAKLKSEVEEKDLDANIKAWRGWNALSDLHKFLVQGLDDEVKIYTLGNTLDALSDRAVVEALKSFLSGRSRKYMEAVYKTVNRVYLLTPPSNAMGFKTKEEFERTEKMAYLDFLKKGDRLAKATKGLVIKRGVNNPPAHQVPGERKRERPSFTDSDAAELRSENYLALVKLAEGSELSHRELSTLRVPKLLIDKLTAKEPTKGETPEQIELAKTEFAELRRSAIQQLKRYIFLNFDAWHAVHRLAPQQKSRDGPELIQSLLAEADHVTKMWDDQVWIKYFGKLEEKWRQNKKKGGKK
eukprot:Filipodium_phascolosomae@DN2035_c0_g1_i1.p1